MLREHCTHILCFCPLQVDMYSQSNASIAPTTITPDNKHWVKLTTMANMFLYSPACYTHYITNAPGGSCTTLTDCSTLDYARSCFCVFVNEGHQMWPVILVC